MGTREKDLNPDVFIGLQLPLRYEDPHQNSDLDPNDPDRSSNVAQAGVEGFFPRTRTLREQASHNIKMLLQTIPGERIGSMSREGRLFGSELHRLLFEPMTEDYKELVAEEIREVMGIWLPYIDIKDLQISYNSNQVDVSLKFGLVNDPEEFEVTANFEQWSDYIPEDVGMNVGGGEGYELPEAYVPEE